MTVLPRVYWHDRASRGEVMDSPEFINFRVRDTLAVSEFLVLAAQAVHVRYRADVGFHRQNARTGPERTP